jgi:DNA (cytosine-5)-methyltransferase 1
MVENVPGLLSSADGRDFAIVLRTLADIGYGLAWRVLDARYFGVPQRRRRVFIVGHLGGDPGPAVLAVGAGGEGDLEAGRCSWQDAPQRASNGVGGTVHALTTSKTGGSVTEDGTGRGAPLVARALTTSQERLGDGFDQDCVTQVSALQAPNGRGWRVDAEGAAGGHLIAAPLTKGSATGEGVNPPGRRQEDDVNLALHASGVRRLTPTECERLMSWPDGWTLADSKTADSRRYAACGDGVVSNVAEWIGRRIMAVDALETANPHPEGRGSVD